MAKQKENSITAIVTDPPYGVKEYTEIEIEKQRQGKAEYGEYHLLLTVILAKRFPGSRLLMMILKKEKRYITFSTTGAKKR